MIKKRYVPRCARAGCTDARVHLLDRLMRERIPADLLKQIPQDQEIWHCTYCNFVWYQPSSTRPGVDASALGYVSDSGEFIENRTVSIRDWRENFTRIPPQPLGRRDWGRRRRR